LLGVPLLRDGVPIGVLVLLRTNVAPFTDKQIMDISLFNDDYVVARPSQELSQLFLIFDDEDALRHAAPIRDLDDPAEPCYSN
jgi:hypothetical protein